MIDRSNRLRGRNRSAKRGVVARRDGFSLLEVVLALALFFASAAALSQLLMVGWKTARWCETAGEAAARCETILAELACRIRPVEPEPAEPLENEDDWESEIDVSATGIPGLVRVTVTVRHFANDRRDAEVSLVRLFAEADEPAAQRWATDVSPVPEPTWTMEQMLGMGASP